MLMPGKKTRSRRLRKKLRIGEFQKHGFEVEAKLAGHLKPEKEDSFIDAFLSEIIEPRSLIFGGGLNSGFVARGGRASATEDDRESVRSWLLSRPEVESVVIGPLVDAWHIVENANYRQFNPLIKYLPANESGEDYVCGDLHGHKQALMEKLNDLGFDFSRDRLFCTGDLTDRGPDSFGTLMLMHEPWFHFVKGNHEDDLPKFLELEYHTRPAYCDQQWVFDLDAGQLEYLKDVLVPELAAVPMAIRVGQDFWVIHSDRCEAGGYQNPAILLDDERLPSADSVVQRESFLWSRRLFNQIPRRLDDNGGLLVAPGQEIALGVGLTFVGHNIIEQPIFYRSHCFIDTGVYMPGGRLTVLRVKDVRERIALIAAQG